MMNGTADAEAAFMIINTGGRDVVINKITVRGQDSCMEQLSTLSYPQSQSLTICYVH